MRRRFRNAVALRKINRVNIHRQQDVFEGVPVLVGGGNWIYVSPAVSIGVGPLTFQAEIKLPVYRSLANRQLDSSRSFQLGIVWTPG